MELIRKPIHYTQAGKSIFDQFYLDEDYSVPEQNADVQRVVCGSARLSAEEIRPVENYIRITGKLYFRVLYMTDPGDPKPAVLEGRLPYGSSSLLLRYRNDRCRMPSIRIPSATYSSFST